MAMEDRHLVRVLDWFGRSLQPGDSLITLRSLWPWFQ